MVCFDMTSIQNKNGTHFCSVNSTSERNEFPHSYDCQFSRKFKNTNATSGIRVHNYTYTYLWSFCYRKLFVTLHGNDFLWQPNICIMMNTTMWYYISTDKKYVRINVLWYSIYCIYIIYQYSSQHPNGWMKIMKIIQWK